MPPLETPDVAPNAALVGGFILFRDYLRRFLQTGLSSANALSPS